MLAPRLAVVALLLSAAACSHVPVASLARLNKLDFATTDPAAIRAALKLPSALRVRAAELVLAFEPADGKREQRAFRLEESAEATQAAVQEIKPRPNERLAAFRVAPADVPGLSAFRKEILTRSAASGGSPRRTLSVRVTDACQESEPPEGALRVSTYLLTSELGSYVPLALDVDLRSVGPEGGLARLGACGG